MFNPHGFQNCDSRLLDREILRTDWRTTLSWQCIRQPAATCGIAPYSLLTAAYPNGVA